MKANLFALSEIEGRYIFQDTLAMMGFFIRICSLHSSSVLELIRNRLS
jgi:hypothetical protein